ncbi:MAG: hypothetical protein H0X16_06770 [Chloroflexi bacterium]|nr:hypothetical protein [Chloroflexota bacterium]
MILPVFSLAIFVGAMLVFLIHLESVVAGLAVDLALPAVAQDWEPPAGQAVGEGIESSHWVVLATDRASLMPIERHGNWREIRAVTSSPAWTDDFSNIVTALDWAR